MTSKEKTILLVSDDLELCAAARRELERREAGPRLAAVRSVDAARRVLEEEQPAVILLEESSIWPDREDSMRNVPKLSSVASTFAVHAPVVVIGSAEQQKEVARLLDAGAVDFVERTQGCMEIACERIQRRLQQSQQFSETFENAAHAGRGSKGEAFGELLRHELNNPLTGILGNAELLLAELRRKNDGLLPRGGQQRLETIAALAVRMRETVRRLSQGLESGGGLDR